MNKRPDILRLIKFQQLLLKFRSIERRVYIPPGLNRPENDVEHSYSLTMAVWFLAQYFPKIDTNKVIRLALVHDLVEIHAGDTWAYGKEHELASKKDRELEALKQLEKDWPDLTEMLVDIEEYEALSTEESKFVYAMDKLLPAILNYLGEGEIWHEESITFEKFMEEKEAKIPKSKEIYKYHKQFVKLLNDHPGIFPEPRNSNKTK